ncbi:MAG: SIMPL domain-containing protein, partial [Planctomycetota bacterium]
KATAMAKELDAKLRSVKSIQEAGEPRGMYSMMQNTNAAVFTPSDSGVDRVLAPGQIEVTANVNVEFYLQGESLDK